MTRVTELTPLLKRVQLGPMAATLPERIALARRDQLDYASFLEIILSGEVNRRSNRRMELRIRAAGFEETCRLEDFDWSAAITLDRRLLDAVFSLEFLSKHEHVLLVGPAGVGKTFLAQALGYTAVRAGHTVRFLHSDDFFRAITQARVDNSLERTFRSFLSPDLLILDDLGLHKLTAQQSADLYELIIGCPPVFQLHHHQQQDGRGVAQPLRRPHPGVQRARPPGQRQLPNSHRGGQLLGPALCVARRILQAEEPAIATIYCLWERIGLVKIPSPCSGMGIIPKN